MLIFFCCWYFISVFLNIRLESYQMVVTASVSAPPRFITYPLHSFGHTLSLFINGYGKFTSLHHTISYPQWSHSPWMTMSVYNLFLSFLPFSLQYIRLLICMILGLPHFQHWLSWGYCLVASKNGIAQCVLVPLGRTLLRLLPCCQ